MTDLVNFLSDIVETGIDHPCLILVGDTHSLPELGAALPQTGRPFQHVGRSVDGVVIGKYVHGGIHELQPAARLEVFQGLLHQLLPVFHRALEAASMDEVEWLGEVPGRFEIVDFKDTIWWDPGRVRFWA